MKKRARGRIPPTTTSSPGWPGDVENRWTEFHGRTIEFDEANYPNTSSDPAATAVAHAGITHDYATFREACFRFYLTLRDGLEAEFAGERNIYYVFEPWALWGTGGWGDLYTTYIRTAIEAPFLTDTEKRRVLGDYLTMEGADQKQFHPGSEGGYLDEIEATGYLTRKNIGSSTQSTYDFYYDPVEQDNLTFLGELARVGVWFNSFGALNRTMDDISDWSDELVLARLLPNWENINGVAEADRSWDGTNLVYSSAMSYADRDVIYARQPTTGLLFAVFLSNSGRISLKSGEQVTQVRKTNEVYEAQGPGSEDAMSALDINGETVTLSATGQTQELYVITVQ